MSAIKNTTGASAAAPIIIRSVTQGIVQNSTASTTVGTDTIPANTVKSTTALGFYARITKTGTGTCAIRIVVSDGTNALQTASGTSAAGAVGYSVANEVQQISSTQQISDTNSVPSGVSYTPVITTLDPTKAWTVSYNLQQSVSADVSTLVFRRIEAT